MASVQQERIDVQCPRCPRVLATAQGLTRHLRSVHGVVAAERRCTRCKRVKTAERAFAVLRLDGQGRPIYRSECERCRGDARAAARASAAPESHRRRDRNANARRRFGLTAAQYDAVFAQLLEQQAGGCAVCGGTDRLVLDHCHATGAIRGVLCHGCNVAAGFLKDNTATALALALYLKRGQ